MIERESAKKRLRKQYFCMKEEPILTHKFKIFNRHTVLTTPHNEIIKVIKQNKHILTPVIKCQSVKKTKKELLAEIQPKKEEVNEEELY